MAQATATGASPSEQFVDVLALTLACELDQAQFRQLRDLGARRVITDRRSEMLQQLELITTGIHVDEIDNDHATDVAQLELACNFNGRFAIGPKHCFPGVGRAGE